MTDRKPNRRDFFRMFRGGAPEAETDGGRTLPLRERVPVPVERGRAVVDISVHPIPPGKDLLVTPTGVPGAILVARPSAGHYAAVSGDCPHCGYELRYDPALDAAACQRGGGAWRLDGRRPDGGGDLRLATYVVRRAGPRVEIELAAPPDA